MSIEKVAVIGAGVMGSGIAAQIANAGLPVLLFDVKNPADVPARMAAQGPSGPFMALSRASLVETLSLEDDFARLGEADWICEVIVENRDVKRDLYAKLETVRRAHSVISSNTSTIPLAQLIQGRSQAFKEHFLITHFFNPPRQMRLLEFVTGPDTLAPVAAMMSHFCEEKLGKGVVPCFDRPGFIANRIGVFWLMTALHEAIAHKIDVDAADAALAKGYGIPKTGAFGLIDLIGLDLMPKMAVSLAANLGPQDPFHKVGASPKLLIDMIAAGYTGRKGKGGFGKMLKNADGTKTKLSLDLTKPFGEDSYAPSKKTDPATDWARSVMDKTLDYATSLLGEVSDQKAAIDAAMVWGYGWKKGPFGLRGETVALPHPKDAVFVHDLATIEEDEHACLRDAGNGLAVLQFKTKMNVLDIGLFSIIEDLLTRDLKGLVIATDEAHFSAGANIARFLESDAADFVQHGQRVMKALRAAPFPVVAATCGLAIGGGCELSLHATAIVAHAETNIGLVEPRVGVLPGWGGCVETLRRLGAPEALKTIMAQWTSSSALDAQEKGYLSQDDVIVMNRDLLLARALAHVKTLPKPEKIAFKAASAADKNTMQNWLDTSGLKNHDLMIGQHLMGVLSAPTEEAVWNAEYNAFLVLLQTDEAKKRIGAILGH